jgi:hypothetical protein
MNAGSVLAHFLRPSSNEARAAAELFDAGQPIRLTPVLAEGELPPEFEDILQVQVLGYRERLTTLDGQRLRVLEPIWTLVPKDE